MKYGQIVKFNGELGSVVEDNNKFYFLPVKYGSYYCSNLEQITDSTIIETTKEEQIQFIEQSFWGSVVGTHCIGEYQIIEYMEENELTAGYHTYINFRDTNSTYSTLDNALIGVIARNSLEVNTANYATSFILKMLNKI